MQKNTKQTYSNRKEEAMDALFDMFDVSDAIGLDGKRALANPVKDFKDSLIAESAARNGMDAIITYNTKDFSKSPVKAMLPTDFAKAFKPANVAYEEIPWP